MSRLHKKLATQERSKREAKRARRVERARAELQEIMQELRSQLGGDRKRRHHYVWRHYLDAWSNSDGRIWSRRNGPAFLAATEKVGLQKDFYRLREMTRADLRWVQALVIDRIPDVRRRKLARGWIPMFDQVFRLRDLASELGASSPELEEAFDLTVSNLEESLHTDAESNAIGSLDALRRGEAPMRDTAEAYVDFARFVGLQYMRTPRMAASVAEALAEAKQFDAAAAWGLMRTIFATHIGEHIYLRRTTTTFRFLEAGPSVQFITGDQPIVNLGGTARMELFYPVTPARALMLLPDLGVSAIETSMLTDDETRSLNSRINEASGAAIYAASEVALGDLTPT